MKKKLFLFISIFLILAGWILSNPQQAQACGEYCLNNSHCGANETCLYYEVVP